MTDWTILKSKIDRSVNFIKRFDAGKIEARYVRREDDYFIIYVSSHLGCSHSCRFCHLTSTGQTNLVPVTIAQYIEQSDRVFEYYDSVKDVQGSANKVHVNFMSRGEALSNPHLLQNAAYLIDQLTSRAKQRGLDIRFNISSIIPLDFTSTLVEAFDDLPITFYYSLYSASKDFRKRWIPKSHPLDHSVKLLKEYQETTGNKIVLHWCFIEEENDSTEDVNAMFDLLERYDLNFNVNIVRYNPPNDRSKESSQKVIDRNLEIIKARHSGSSKVVHRVGTDCYASCGTFLS